jgi:hypothetical protein
MATHDSTPDSDREPHAVLTCSVQLQAASGAAVGKSLLLPRMAYEAGYALAQFLSSVHSAWLGAEEDQELPGSGYSAAYRLNRSGIRESARRHDSSRDWRD